MGIAVSVVIPAYNAENVITDAVKSVLSQTYKNTEIIVIDDCSEDGTYDLLCRMAAKDQRLKIVKNNGNIGVSETRNRGVNIASGDYVAFLDSDDIWYTDKLETQVSLAEKYPECPVFFTGVSYINSAGELFDYELSVPETVSYKKLLKQNVITCSSVMAKREVLLRYPFEHDEMHEDFAVWLQILRDVGDARSTERTHIFYRVAEGTKSSNKFKSALMTWRVYRYVGLNVLQRLFYMPFYLITGVLKHRHFGKLK